MRTVQGTLPARKRGSPQRPPQEISTLFASRSAERTSSSWRACRPRRCRFSARVFQHQSALFLSSLLVSEAEPVPWEERVRELPAGYSFPGLRDLTVACGGRSWIGELTQTWPLVPNLERAAFRGRGIGLGGPLPAKLRALSLAGSVLERDHLELLLDDFPASLRELSLELRGARFPAGVAAKFLRQPSCAGLEVLRLIHSESTDELCRLVLEAPGLCRLRVLDLSRGSITYRGAQFLLANRALLEHLDALVLGGGAVADAGLQRRLGEELRNVVL